MPKPWATLTVEQKGNHLAADHGWPVESVTARLDLDRAHDHDHEAIPATHVHEGA